MYFQYRPLRLVDERQVEPPLVYNDSFDGEGVNGRDWFIQAIIGRDGDGLRAADMPTKRSHIAEAASVSDRGLASSLPGVGDRLGSSGGSDNGRKPIVHVY